MKVQPILIVIGQSAHVAMSGATPEGCSDRLTKLTLVERAGGTQRRGAEGKERT
jgi:hypothetical protein